MNTTTATATATSAPRITVRSHFKEVKRTDSVHYGKTRENLEWTFAGVSGELLASMDSSQLEKVAVLVNDSLEQHGRKLLLENGENWEYVPSDSDVNIDSVATALTSSGTRKRTVTKVTLAAAAEFYRTYAVELLDKSNSQAEAGAKIIEAKLVPIAGKKDVLQVLADNITELFEAAVAASGNSILVAEKLEENAPVLEWLIDECSRLIAESDIDLASAL